MLELWPSATNFLVYHSDGLGKFIIWVKMRNVGASTWYVKKYFGKKTLCVKKSVFYLCLSLTFMIRPDACRYFSGEPCIISNWLCF